MNSVRFLLIIPAVIITWIAVIVLGFVLYSWVSGWFCSPDGIENGTCSMPAVLSIGLLILVIGSSGMVPIIFATLLAPSKKYEVSIAVFVVGSISTVLVSGLTFLPYWILSVLFGLLTVRVLRDRLKEIGKEGYLGS